jgi:LemA protein
MGRLMAVFEAYPDLKANQNILQVQEELTSTENKIAFARQAYNDTVMEYNTQREVFPNTVFAACLVYAATLLEATESAEERKAPKVSFK